MSDSLETTIQHTLDALDIAYEVMACDPALADTTLFCEHYAIPAENSANTIIVTSKSGEKKFAACMLLSNARLDVNKAVRKRLGVRRISFASPDETRELTGMVLGGVTPLALPDDLPLWIDQKVMEADYIILGGGARSSKIKISPSVFLKTPNTSIVEGLAKPITTEES